MSPGQASRTARDALSGRADVARLTSRRVSDPDGIRWHMRTVVANGGDVPAGVNILSGLPGTWYCDASGQRPICFDHDQATPPLFFGRPVDKSENRKGRLLRHSRQITRTSAANSPGA